MGEGNKMDTRIEEIKLSDKYIKTCQAVYSFRTLMKHCEDYKQLSRTEFGPLLVVYNENNAPIARITKEDFMIVLGAAENYAKSIS